MTFQYAIGESKQTLVIEQSVLDHFEEWRQNHTDKAEAGGQLFGEYTDAAIFIKLATGPRRTDKRGRFFFFADRFAEKVEIEKLHKRGLHYFGGWHTHPQSVPSPSITDLDSMKELYTRSMNRPSFTGDL